MKYIVIYLLSVNLITFLVYGLDKWKAKRDKWRVPEKTLILLAVIGGTIGALLGMQVLRHKTKHIKFTVGIPVILVAQLVLVWFLFLR